MRVTDKQQPPARKPPVPTRACIVEGARPLLEPLAVAAESNQDDGPWGKGLSRSLLNFASGGLPVSLYEVVSMLRHVSKHAVGRGQRVQRTDQVQQVAVAPDPPETRFRLQPCSASV